jgi:spore germination cell wall hydrolase CwlJ-like protein
MIDMVLAVVMSASPVDMECLAKNIYFESRNQSHLGQISVAHVTLNRLVDDRYPDTICDVVQQGRQNADGSMRRHQCQFSWYCDGLSDRPRNDEMWEQSWDIAEESMDLYIQGIDVTRGATHYHAKNVYPNWAPTLDKIMRVDDHIFYRWD